MNDNIVPIDDDRVFVPRGTLYQWHSKGKYPALVFKLKGKLYFDLDEWGRMLEDAQRDSLTNGRSSHGHG